MESGIAGSIVEIGGAMLSSAERCLEVSAQNIANMTTPGYKARRYFAGMVADGGVEKSPDASARNPSAAMDFSVGRMTNTGNPYDLAIPGSGFFTVRAGDTTLYTRDGQFSRDDQGHLIHSSGAVLQADSGDLVLHGGKIQVLGDGTVLDDGEPAAHLTLADFPDKDGLRPLGAGLFAADRQTAQPIAVPQVRQGMLETSNVSTAAELVMIMAANRGAESGQHLVQVYDDLMGRVIEVFGQS